MSKYNLTNQDVAIVLAMKNRGDKIQDVTAWFGVNQGRADPEEIAKLYPSVTAADQSALADIPKGPPGVKGRKLRAFVRKALKALDEGDANKARKELQDGLDAYNKHES